jgi:hypothetical protein
MAAGWDEAVAEVQKAEHRKNAPNPDRKRRMFGTGGGMNA